MITADLSARYANVGVRNAEKEAIANIREEYTDVVQCAGELSLTVDEEQMARKHERWEKRVRDIT